MSVLKRFQPAQSGFNLLDIIGTGVEHETQRYARGVYFFGIRSRIETLDRVGTFVR